MLDIRYPALLSWHLTLLLLGGVFGVLDESKQALLAKQSTKTST
jgi:hypothetical protein